MLRPTNVINLLRVRALLREALHAMDAHSMFARPVVSDYPQLREAYTALIKFPVCLGDIRSRLTGKTQAYSYVGEFYRDLCLVAYNSYRFNKENADVIRPTNAYMRDLCEQFSRFVSRCAKLASRTGSDTLGLRNIQPADQLTQRDVAIACAGVRSFQEERPQQAWPSSTSLTRLLVTRLNGRPGERGRVQGPGPGQVTAGYSLGPQVAGRLQQPQAMPPHAGAWAGVSGGLGAPGGLGVLGASEGGLQMMNSAGYQGNRAVARPGVYSGAYSGLYSTPYSRQDPRFLQAPALGEAPPQGDDDASFSEVKLSTGPQDDIPVSFVYSLDHPYRFSGPQELMEYLLYTFPPGRVPRVSTGLDRDRAPYREEVEEVVRSLHVLSPQGRAGCMASLVAEAGAGPDAQGVISIDFYSLQPRIFWWFRRMIENIWCLEEAARKRVEVARSDFAGRAAGRSAVEVSVGPSGSADSAGAAGSSGSAVSTGSVKPSASPQGSMPLNGSVESRDLKAASQPGPASASVACAPVPVGLAPKQVFYPSMGILNSSALSTTRPASEPPALASGMPGLALASAPAEAGAPADTQNISSNLRLPFPPWRGFGRAPAAWQSAFQARLEFLTAEESAAISLIGMVQE